MQFFSRLQNRHAVFNSCKNLESKLLLFLFIVFHSIVVNAQVEKDSSFTGIYLAFRPRAEFKEGYKIPHTSNDKSAFTVSHRADVSFRYQREGAEVFLTLRNADIWGDKENRLPELFEAWTSYSFSEHFSIKAGRQRIMLDIDNDRLFGQRNWSQEGISHDVLALSGAFKSFDVSIIGGMNQRDELYSGTSYPWHEVLNYKYILMLHFQYRINDRINFGGIHVADGFEVLNGSDIFRHTTGGKISLKTKKMNATVYGYYQHGRNQNSVHLDAWYLNPEIIWIFTRKIQLKGGAEVLSGSSRGLAESGKTFVPLYGNAHKFMGHMDYFTSFPAHTKGYGLVNPFLMLNLGFNKGITLTNDFHVFYALFNPIIMQTELKKYYGFEHDLTMTKKLNSFSNLQLGFAYMLPTQAFLNLRNISDGNKFQYFSYCMLTVNPTVLSVKKNNRQ